MTTAFLAEIQAALGALAGDIEVTGAGDLPSVFAVTDLAVAAVGAAGLAISALIDARGQGTPSVAVDRRLASFWLESSLRPDGWSVPPAWDSIAGDYAAADGWIRLHTNAPHHRDAALSVLRVPADKAAVAAAVSRWNADALEAAVVAANGCAAAMRSLYDWAAHPQGIAIAREPLVWMEATGPAPALPAAPKDRPLAGLRVLDATRVLAGPIATRFLAGYGADVLRIDPPTWDEPGVLPGVTLGKRRARLDLRSPEGLVTFRTLLKSADVFVHGYRPDALERLGLGFQERQRIRPGLVDVCLDAYGWSGPWATRRGFDSLVQMSTGIAAEGMRRYGAAKPVPLPVQAIDHATGSLLAAAAIRGLTRRCLFGEGTRVRMSLARTALLLTAAGPVESGSAFVPAGDVDFEPVQEQTGWGPGWRLKAPLLVEGAPVRWDFPAGPLGVDDAVWLF
jgi:CoA-transferase family III